MENIKEFFKSLKIYHYVIFSLVLSIGVFNAITALSPVIKQRNAEKNIEIAFKDYWENQRLNELKSFGFKIDDEIKEQEFEQFHARYAKDKHSYIIEERIEEINTEFREWWEIKGGKEQFAKNHGYYPKEEDFKKEKHAWIKKFKDKHLRYSMAFVPSEEEFERLATSWILFPSFLSYLIFACFFIFVCIQLSKRWGFSLFASLFIGLAIFGGIIVYFFTTTSFFIPYITERYMGSSIALAFLLGATAFGLKKDSIPTFIRAIAISGFVLDLIINFFVNSGIFVAVTFASFIAFILGTIAGTKIPNRRKSFKEIKAEEMAQRLRDNALRNPIAERKAKTRAQIEEGFNAAKKSEYENAQRILGQALVALLQEHPIDSTAIENLATKMTSPKIFIEVPSMQWIEWGEAAKAKKCYKAALILLEKGLSLETKVSIARRTLYNIGEIRTNNAWDIDVAIARLNKVIELNETDILAKQAQQMLEKAKKLKTKES